MKLPYSIFNRDRYSKLRNVQTLEGAAGDVTQEELDAVIGEVDNVKRDLGVVSDNVNTLDGKIETASDLLNTIDTYLGEEFMRDQTDAYITFNPGQKTRSVSIDISREGYMAVGIIRILAENTYYHHRGRNAHHHNGVHRQTRLHRH